MSKFHVEDLEFVVRFLTCNQNITDYVGYTTGIVYFSLSREYYPYVWLPLKTNNKWVKFVCETSVILSAYSTPAMEGQQVVTDNIIGT